MATIKTWCLIIVQRLPSAILWPTENTSRTSYIKKITLYCVSYSLKYDLIIQRQPLINVTMNIGYSAVFIIRKLLVLFKVRIARVVNTNVMFDQQNSG